MEGRRLVSSVFLLLMISQTIAIIMSVLTTNTTSRDGLSFSTSPSASSTYSEPQQPDTDAQGTQTSPQDFNHSVLENSDLPETSILSNVPKESTSSCGPVEETLTGSTGTIAFTEIAEDCTEKWVWNIHLPSPEDGIIIKVNNSSLSSSSEMIIHDHYITHNDYDLSYDVAPATGKDHRVLFPFFIYPANRYRIILTIPYVSNKTVLSTFNLNYTAQPAQKMVRHLCGQQIFDCSGDVVIPSVIRCNKVQECLNNEDEAGCDYLHQDCGEWVPSQNLCLKLFLPNFCRLRFDDYIFGQRKGEELCHTLYGGQLAQLKDIEDMNFVGRIIREAGYIAFVVRIQKVIPVSKNLRHLYRYLWQWGGKGGPIAYRMRQLHRKGMFLNCAQITANSMTDVQVVPVSCRNQHQQLAVNGFVCMKPRRVEPEVTVEAPLSVHLTRPQYHKITQFPTKECADGSLVQTFHQCYYEDQSDIAAMTPSKFSQFSCRYGQAIHYTLVCDGNDDCPDTSDEMHCGVVNLPPLMTSMFICNNYQLVPKFMICDGKYDCFDESDEEGCTTCGAQFTVCGREGCLPKYYAQFTSTCPSHSFKGTNTFFDMWTTGPYAVELDGHGMVTLHTPRSFHISTYFRCMDGNYVPSYLLNNGEQDCPSGEDEHIPPHNITCPGFYRCKQTYSCVHPTYICDGSPDCPYKDDEQYCLLVCPDQCQCEGYAFQCTQFSNSSGLLLARYLDLSGSANISFSDMHFLELLQFLNVSHCGLGDVYLKSMPQLKIFDLSFNEIRKLSSFTFEQLAGLELLNISSNPLRLVLDAMFASFIKISGLNNLKSLVMRHTKIHFIRGRPFNPLTQLEILDIRNNFIESRDRDIFGGLDNLKELYTDDSKLCCPYFHGSRAINCVAPFDELSSCNDLLRQNFFRVFLWLVALLAIVGNTSVMLYRLFIAKQRTFSSFRVLVSNLCAADLIMGIYMIMIGIADAHFRGVYVVKENVWKRSILCAMAGFLGVVSSEASAMTVCLITLDRVLVLCFPLKSHLHLTARSSLAVCGVLWFVVVTLAALPLMVNLEFYGVSSICIPLPVTMRQFAGQFYSFGVFIIFNFILFVLIGLGQIFIYRSILIAGKGTGSERRPQEMTIARRLFLVILSDFCCWFPVGLMGLLVARGTPISGEVNVWTAIFVLPLNSALNPFLYTLNTFLEKWRIEKLKRKTQKILSNIQSQLPKLPLSTTEELLKICIRSNVVKREKILHMLHVSQDSVMRDTVSQVDSQTMSSLSP